MQSLLSQRGADRKKVLKQWGGTNKKRAGRLLDGRTYDEFPTR
jgi:protein gp37